MPDLTEVGPLAADPLSAARFLLGAQLRVDAGSEEEVTVRILEVEAYGGPPDGWWPDPAAHGYPGPTPRNQVMFGPPGHLYVYRSYGIHFCANVTAGPPGQAAGLLIRAVDILSGQGTVARRRGPQHRHPGRGPGNAAAALGISGADYGLDLLDPDSRVQLLLDHRESVSEVAAGPRTGVRRASERPWRLWIPGHPGVSGYRRHAHPDGLG